ncbi:MAG: peptidoglycan DD-metalloendopeptidase family protein [Sulfurimonas sp.]|nr:peptidoglycan DD-metalloendopeptidase family protein [Sulfurimonas sp.]
MIRLFLPLLLLSFSLKAKTNIDDKIQKTSSEMGTYAKTQEIINKKMDETAQAIIAHEKEIAGQQQTLKKLQENLVEKEGNYGANVEEIKSLKTIQENLKQNSNALEEELVFTIAQSVSLSIILEEEYSASEESLIEYEVLESMLKGAKIKIKELNKEFHENSKNIDVLNQHVSSIESAIASIDAKRKEIKKTQEANIESLQKLKTSKESYKQELKEILDKQDSLKKTLSQLNLIKIDELSKAQEEAQRAEAFSAKESPSKDNLPKVKTQGSSYQAVTTKLYVGEKTIPPFEPYKITKQYGNYTDPIYGIKVFNESISLKPSQPNEKVKTVFNGKVIYADKTPVLNNIVIIEHDNGLHTIYANLSQIAPDIEKGKKVKQGSVIGRVGDELIFEVTQKSFHINPVALFQ